MVKVYLSERANPILIEYLKERKYDISYVFSTTYTYNSVSSHPDMYLCKLGFRKMFYGNPEKLGFNYPENIKYNAAVMGNYFIHNLKFTSHDLLDEVKRTDRKLISVQQGYTKCNLAIIDSHAAITSDQGIAQAIRSADKDGEIDLLVIEPGHIKLKGKEYGFIGGASGRVGDEMIFHGNLEDHPDCGKMVEFVRKHHCRLKYFPEFELEDIGSIIEF